MIYTAGIGLAIFIELLLVSKKNKTGSDKILTLWMLIITIHLFFFHINYTDKIYDYPFLLGIDIPFPYFHGIFLFMYVSWVTNMLPKKKLLLILHFIPIIAAYVYLIHFFILPAQLKIDIYKNNGAEYEVFIAIMSVGLILSGIAYVIWANVILRKHKRRILNQFSDIEKINLRWLQMLTWGIGGIWLLIIFVNKDGYTFGGVVVFVILIGFFGIKQVGIFTPVRIETSGGAKNEKYAKSGLTDTQSEKIYKDLKDKIEMEQVYRKNDITIGDLASSINVNANHLSQVINEREGKNFYEYINNYRVEEFKRLISVPENQKLTLLSLAFECGFNSKSSFNRYFKKVTGKTPSEYFNSIKN